MSISSSYWNIKQAQGGKVQIDLSMSESELKVEELFSGLKGLIFTPLSCCVGGRQERQLESESMKMFRSPSTWSGNISAHILSINTISMHVLCAYASFIHSFLTVQICSLSWCWIVKNWTFTYKIYKIQYCYNTRAKQKHNGCRFIFLHKKNLTAAIRETNILSFIKLFMKLKGFDWKNIGLFCLSDLFLNNNKKTFSPARGWTNIKISRI